MNALCCTLGWVLGGILSLLGLATTALAQCELGPITPYPVQSAAAFGWCIAAQPQRAIVGAYYGGQFKIGSGAAYVFERQGIRWSQAAQIVPSNAAFGDYFGTSAAIEGDRLLIGAIGVQHVQSTGSVYVYELEQNAWVRKSRIDPRPVETLLEFGHAVALSGDTMLISACAVDHNHFEGSVFVYRLIGGQWFREARLISSTDPNAVLGWSLALEGDRAAIGAASTSGVPDAGAAYIFERISGTAEWQQVAKFTPADLQAHVGYGKSIALRGDRLAVGAYIDHVHGHSAGTVYVYQKRQSDWELSAKLSSGRHEAYEYFGYSVAMTDDLLAVGAINADGPGVLDCGQIVLFQRQQDSWVQTQAHVDQAYMEQGAAFGYAVAFAGDMVLAGAINAHAPEPYCGSVTAFSASDADCNRNGVVDLCDLISGGSSDENVNAIPDECEQPPLPPPCPADCAPNGSTGTGDGVVNIDDLVFITANWGESGGFGPADIVPPGGDGLVDIDDLTLVLTSWGPCPLP